ncbi:MAG: rRNA maturation RNase YbeY [Candidatus Altimarinota bacterium]
MKLNVIGHTQYSIRHLKRFHLICDLVDQSVKPLPGYVNLIFCDDSTLHRLNRDFRKKDKVTDVLTFTYYDESQLRTPDPEFLLGEVILSIPQTKRQAKEYGVTFESEMYKLCIHGLLHLRGYDHEADEDYRVMKLLEDKIMRSFLKSKKTGSFF